MKSITIYKNVDVDVPIELTQEDIERYYEQLCNKQIIKDKDINEALLSAYVELKKAGKPNIANDIENIRLQYFKP